MSGEGEGFLSRWSRRKREAAAAPEPAAPEPAAEAPAELPADQPLDVQAEAAPAEPAKPRQACCPIPNLPEIDLASLPRIEDLTAQSDFSLFLRPGIPQALRNAALRRMWSLDPAIRDYIGPVEYQWDFNAPGGLPFGFANELAGDIGRLLAQAIGKVEELVGPEPDDASPGTADGGGEGDAPVAESPVAAVPPDEPAPAPLPEAEEPAPSLPIRRRHGGALPA